MIRFIMITNDPVLAKRAETAGVERLFVDLEQIGKQQRQGHLDTLISSHSLDDVGRVKAALDRADLIVRLNPLHGGSDDEIETAIANGADTLMLPMFHSADEVADFCRRVDKRVRVMPLVETHAALLELDSIVTLPGVSEIYIGLNDLHLDMGLTFMFEPLADGLIDEAAKVVKRAGLAFGFGGVARVNQGIVPGELVLAEHARLGSSSVILSRTFNQELTADDGHQLAHEVGRLKAVYQDLQLRTPQQIEQDRDRLRQAVHEFVHSKINETAV